MGLEVTPAGDEAKALTATVMRELPLGRLTKRSLQVATAQLAIASMGRAALERLSAVSLRDPIRRQMVEIALTLTDDERAEIKASVPVVLAAIDPPKGRKRERGDEHFEEVASVYLKAVNHDSKNPTKDVADHFCVTRSAAAKWVARARDMHLLPRTTQGRATRLPATRRKAAS